MANDKIKVAPEVCSYADDERAALIIEISLPGVRKEDVSLRMHADSLALSAPRADLEYVTTLSFCCPVQPDKAQARYENGLLKIEVPFKDTMEDAIRVQID